MFQLMPKGTSIYGNNQEVNSFYPDEFDPTQRLQPHSNIARFVISQSPEHGCETNWIYRGWMVLELHRVANRIKWTV